MIKKKREFLFLSHSFSFSLPPSHNLRHIDQLGPINEKFSQFVIYLGSDKKSCITIRMGTDFLPSAKQLCFSKTDSLLD